MNRHPSATDYNERSSRSHTIFQMTIESKDINDGSQIDLLTNKPKARPMRISTLVHLSLSFGIGIVAILCSLGKEVTLI